MASLPDVDSASIPNHYSGDLSEFAPEFIQGKLHEVVDQINVRWGSKVAARLASGALPRRLYDAVVVRVASRVFENIEGYKSEAEGQYNYELNAVVASGYLWFTDIDEKDLTGEVEKHKKGRIGTIRAERYAR